MTTATTASKSFGIRMDFPPPRPALVAECVGPEYRKTGEASAAKKVLGDLGDLGDLV